MNSRRAQREEIKAVGTRLAIGKPGENRRRAEVCCSLRLSFILLAEYRPAEDAVLILIILGYL